MNVVQVVTTDPLDPGSLLRMAFVIAIIVIEFYFQRRLIMATKQELLDAVNGVTEAVANEITRVTQTIQDLKDQVAKGGNVTEADLDGPVQSLNALRQSLDTVDVTPSGTVTSEIPGSTSTAPTDSTGSSSSSTPSA